MKPPRVGLVRNFFPERTGPVVQAAVEAAAQKLRDAGATVTEVLLPEAFGLVWHTHCLVLRAEGSTLRASLEARAMANGEPVSFAAGGHGLQRLGELVPANYCLHAQRIRRMLIGLMSGYFEQQGVDALLTAIAPTPAPKGLQSTGDPMLLAPWSHLGFPAIAVQSGDFSPDGQPIGLQFAGPPLADYRLLCAGAWVESALGRLPAPPLE